MTLWHNIYCNDEWRECKPHHKARHQNTSKYNKNHSKSKPEKYPKIPKASQSTEKYAKFCWTMWKLKILKCPSLIFFDPTTCCSEGTAATPNTWSMDEHEVMISDDSQNDSQQKARGWWSETGTSKLQTARLFLSFSPMFARHAVMLASSKGSVQELLAGSWLAPSLLGNHLQNSTNLQTLCFAGNHLQTNHFANPCGILSTVVAKCCQWLRVTPQQIRRDKFCQTFTPISAISLWFDKKRTRKSWLERVSWTEMNGILGCCGQ